MNTKLNILITTGIYPPKIGGPAQYAKNIKNNFSELGHNVSVKTFGIESAIPSGLRHIFFGIKIIPKVLFSDVVFILDTFSVGLPSVFICKIFGTKSIIRTGGDFIWEQYVERTGKKVLLKNFYNTEKINFSMKDQILFRLTRWALKNSSNIIFSTDWQRQIFLDAYGIDVSKTSIVENYYGQKEESFETNSKVFVGSTRELKWKNIDTLKKIFNKINSSGTNVELFTKNLPFEQFVDKIKNSYAVIQVSLGDISPNMILDSIRCNKPFICTKETGIFDRIKDVGIFVDPLNEQEIENSIVRLLNENEYRMAVDKIKQFNFTHSWREIAEDFLLVYKKIC